MHIVVVVCFSESAPSTRFISVLSTIRQANGPVFAPDFDHRKKDPREDAICIDEAAEV